MLNNNLKKESINGLKQSIKEYNKCINRIKSNSQRLFNVRLYSSEKIIIIIEKYINELANSPKEFDKSFINLKFNNGKFNNVIEQFSKIDLEANIKSGAGAAGGVAAGVGTAALMPSAAMAIATTFGTASTGTAIASLSGAAATNAALAWLGGGAMAAGGGGMAGGSAFLALAGPIGIGIGAIGLIGGGLYKSNENKKIADKANNERKGLISKIKNLDITNFQIKELVKETSTHNKGVQVILEKLINEAPINYNKFTIEQKKMLGSLINNINSLSVLINKTVK